MDALILNREFQAQCVVDAFESFIWVERYREPGDFELYIPFDKTPMEFVKEQYYVWREGSENLMIIEDILIQTDAEVGVHVTITGRTLESILERRVVAYRTVISGNLQNGIQRLLNENAISPWDSDRRIPGLKFVYNSDPRVTSLTCDLNLLGETLLDVIEGQCELNDLGFKIWYDESDNSFNFKLYYGEDRSYAQEKNPWVVFSAEYENLLNSSFYQTSRNLRTAAVVAGSDDEEKGQEIVDVDGKPEMIGLDRREMFIEASDIELPDPVVNEDSIRERLEKRNKTEEEIQAAIDAEYARVAMQDRYAYLQQLQQRGYEELKQTYVTQTFDGEIEAVRQYVYDRDFFIGDVVQVRDNYGKEASSRITEVVMSHDVNGEVLTPTFTTLLGGDNKTEE